MKKLMLVAVLVLVAIVAACSSNQGGNSGTGNSGTGGGNAGPANSGDNSPPPKSPVTLEFATNASGSTLDAYKELAEAFSKEHAYVTVEVQGMEEALMNARMASNDLPDLWTTHGWAVRRYGEYLRPLSDQPWVSQLVDEIVPVITDDGGDLLALPFDVDISGMLYNQTVLDDLGLDVPQTWEQFLAACEAAKAAGYTAVHVGGKDAGAVAGFFSRVALSHLVFDGGFGDALQGGTFDWSNWNIVSEFVLGMKAAGYLNVDHLTADKQTTFTEMAQDRVLFTFESNLAITEILKLNPEAKVTMMQIPSANGQPFLISGERNAVGVWKDTPHEEEALEYLTYLSQPENVKKVAESYSLPAAFQSVEVDLGELEEAFKRYEGSAVSNHFDREYLPNGMWNTLRTAGPGLLSGDMTAEQAATTMRNDYERLRANAN